MDKHNPAEKAAPRPASNSLSAWVRRMLTSGGLTEKDVVFRELGEKFAGSPETVALAQAIWLTGRGQAYARKGRLFKALDCFAEAMSLKRDHIPAYLAMAITFRRLGQAGGSYSYLDVSMNLLKRLPKRVRILQREINLELFGASVYSEWATLYILMGRRDKAAEALEKALRFHQSALESDEEERTFLVQSGCRVDPEFASNLRATLTALNK
jgi:tetratricopeptide (TPR) repeat protein